VKVALSGLVKVVVSMVSVVEESCRGQLKTSGNVIVRETFVNRPKTRICMSFALILHLWRVCHCGFLTKRSQNSYLTM